MPLIVRGYHVTSDLDVYTWAPDNLVDGIDFFLYGKKKLFYIIEVIMLLYLMDYLIIQGGLLRLIANIKEKKIYKPTLIFCLFSGSLIIISTIFSVDVVASLNGMVEQFESIWVCLGYLLLLVYVCMFVQTKEDMKIIKNAMFILLGIECVLGLGQLVGIDFYQIPGVTRALLPEEYRSLAEQIVFSTDASKENKIYASFYHSNYAGVYYAMMLPLVIFEWTIHKNKIKKIILSVLAIADFICLLGTESKSGIVAICLVTFIYLFGFAIKKYRRELATLIGIGIMMCALTAICVTFVVNEKNTTKSLDEHIKGYHLENIVLGDHEVAITMGKEIIKIWYEKNGEAFYLKGCDGTGKDLNFYIDEVNQTYQLQKENFGDVFFQCYEKNGISYILMMYDGLRWRFTQDTPNGGFGYINMYGKLTEIKKAETIGFKHREGIFSGRGYIWSRTLPLLKEYILIGSGPDTFITVFPQQDYVGKACLGVEFFAQIITRPHNMYLQMAIQTGAISLAVFLIFFGYIINIVLRKMWELLSIHVEHLQGNKENHIESYELMNLAGVFGAILVYLVMGITNDSMLVTAPLFWVLLGVMIVNNDINLNNN